MKIAKYVGKNFSKERLRGESPREYALKYFSDEHVDIILGLSEEMNLSTEEAVGYALAMFNSLQDLFNMHVNLTLPNVGVATTEPKDEDEKKVKFAFKMRGFLKEPYAANAHKAYEEAIIRLPKKVKRAITPTKAQIRKQEVLDNKQKKKQTIKNRLERRKERAKKYRLREKLADRYWR